MPPSRRRPVAAVALALAAALLQACGDDDGGAGTPSATTARGEEPGAVVTVRDLKYSPKVVRVAAGELVTWEFRDGSIPHDVEGSGFESPVLERAEWSHRFETPGSYPYTCSLHPFMKGTVEVSAVR